MVARASTRTGRRPLRLSALLALLALGAPGLIAAEDPPTTVPDPDGLGERLALIDYLHAHGQTVTPGEELSQLRSAYRDLTGATTPSGADAEKSARDEAVLTLWRTYNVVAPENETLAQLQKRLVDLANRSQSAQDDELQHERADDHSAAAQAASAPTPAAPAADAPSTAPPGHARSGQGLPWGGTLATLAAVQEVPRPTDTGEQVHAYLISPGTSPILLVCLDPEVLEPMRSQLRAWPAETRVAAGIKATVIIHGHSSGAYFNQGVMKDPGAPGGDLAEHLRRNREYYETLAATRERSAIDFAVMTGCNPSGDNQEQELRDGFGYRPLHRVFTAPSSLDAAPVVLPAIIAAGSRAADGTPYHASFTWYQTIPELGKQCTISCYAAIDDDAMDIKEHMHRFVVSPSGVTEQAPAP